MHQLVVSDSHGYGRMVDVRIANHAAHVVAVH